MVAMSCGTTCRRRRDGCASGRHHVPRRARRCLQRPRDAVSTRVAVGRYYDPQTGQFLSVDPKVQETQQAYIYASNNPVNMLDPNGLNSRGCSLLVCIEIFSQNGHGLFVTMIWIWNRPMEYLPIGTAVWYTMNQFGVPPRYVKVPNRDVGLYFTPKRDFPNKALVCGRIGDFPGFPCQTVRK
jgi:hypothetical protein